VAGPSDCLKAGAQIQKNCFSNGYARIRVITIGKAIILWRNDAAKVINPLFLVLKIPSAFSPGSPKLIMLKKQGEYSRGKIDETGYPQTIVVDKSGTISHIEHGTSPLQRETLKQKIQEVQ
jgi:hypothetical protein